MANLKLNKRHYEFIAETLQSLAVAFPDIPHAHVVSHFASALRGTNGAFKQDRFIAACQPGANVKARG